MKSVGLIFFGLLIPIVQANKHVVSKLRIVNGDDVALGEIPNLVAVSEGIDHDCGGSILNEYWVVTAAHCVKRASNGSRTIIAGTVDMREPYSLHQSEIIIPHAGYGSRKNSYRHDIALIKVSNPFKFSVRIQPVPLPKSHATLKANSSAVVSGWGKLAVDGPPSDILKKATVYITDSKVCRDALSYTGMDISPTQICANNPSVRTGECKYDSGGPLTINGVLTGIVSWSVKTDGCASPRYPGVFTRVSEYVDWINEHIK